MCLFGSVVTPWSLTQEVEGSNHLFYYNIFVIGFKETSNLRMKLTSILVSRILKVKDDPNARSLVY